LSGRAGTADQFAQAIDYLKEKFNEPLRTAELAKMAGMSVSQFERRFRRALGSSPRQYLLRLRVDSAARLLTFTNRPIAQISKECGFHDHAHFTRSFKKMMSMTPLSFRKRQQGL
jgi:transcriptional regulator GlxA family with amidase domain